MSAIALFRRKTVISAPPRPPRGYIIITQNMRQTILPPCAPHGSQRLLKAFLLASAGAGLLVADPLYSFTTIDIPGSGGTYALAISNAGEIGGVFLGPAGYQGFVGSGSSFAPFHIPVAAQFTWVNGINDAGEIGGSFVVSYPGNSSGFIQSGSSFTRFDVPGAVFTAVQAINDLGQIAGNFGVSTPGSGNVGHGFVQSGSSFTQIDYPGALSTTVFGINNTGEIVGSFASHGFLKSGSSFTQLDVPGGPYSEAIGINDSGEIILDNGSDGYLLAGSSLTRIDVPGAMFTQLNGINDAGQIVGDFVDANGADHGFLATPVPEPGSFLLAGISLLILARHFFPPARSTR